MNDYNNFRNPDTALSARIFARLGEIMFGRRWLWMVLLVCITIVAVFGMRMLRFDNSNEVWFVENDSIVKLLDKFRTIFGNEDFVVLLFESEDFFEVENIRLLGRLAGALEGEVPCLWEMTWLGNVEYIEGTEEGISIYGLLDSIPESREGMDRVRKKALKG